MLYFSQTPESIYFTKHVFIEIQRRSKVRENRHSRPWTFQRPSPQRVFVVSFSWNEFKFARNFDGSRCRRYSSIPAATWCSPAIVGVARLPWRTWNHRNFSTAFIHFDFLSFSIQIKCGKRFSIASSTFPCFVTLILRKSTGRCLVQICCSNPWTTSICIRSFAFPPSAASKVELKANKPVCYVNDSHNDENSKQIYLQKSAWSRQKHTWTFSTGISQRLNTNRKVPAIPKRSCKLVSKICAAHHLPLWISWFRPCSPSIKDQTPIFWPTLQPPKVRSSSTQKRKFLKPNQSRFNPLHLSSNSHAKLCRSVFKILSACRRRNPTAILR